MTKNGSSVKPVLWGIVLESFCTVDRASPSCHFQDFLFLLWRYRIFYHD